MGWDRPLGRSWLPPGVVGLRGPAPLLIGIDQRPPWFGGADILSSLSGRMVGSGHSQDGLIQILGHAR
jgi:hypothetical protein